MPRRTRRRITGKWEQIEREAREEELRELERELHEEQQRGRKAKPKRRSMLRGRRTEPNASDTGTDSTNSDG